MSRRSATWLALAAAALPACGNDGDGTIPPENANTLRAELEELEQARAQGLCDNAQAAAVRFRTAVNGLGADVDREVKGALQEGANQLVELSSDPAQCGATGTTGVQEETTPATSTTTETSTDEPPPDQPPADAGGGDDGQGNGPNGGGAPGQAGGSPGGGNGSGGTGSGKGGG